MSVYNFVSVCLPAIQQLGTPVMAATQKNAYYALVGGAPEAYCSHRVCLCVCVCYSAARFSPRRQRIKQ